MLMEKVRNIDMSGYASNLGEDVLLAFCLVWSSSLSSLSESV